MDIRFRHLFIIPGALFLLALQCKKSNPAPDNPYGLPNATQTGAWTMGCLINGRTWVSPDYNLMATLRGDSIVGVLGKSLGRFSNEIMVGVRGNMGLFPVSHPLPIDSCCTLYYVTDSSCLGGTVVTALRAIKGSITITRLDAANHIFSGTFNGTMPMPNCDTLYITYGRFDVPLYIP
jgi:hypothetical protein